MVEKITCPYCGESLYRHPKQYILDKEYIYYCKKCQQEFNKTITNAERLKKFLYKK